MLYLMGCVVAFCGTEESKMKECPELLLGRHWRPALHGMLPISLDVAWVMHAKASFGVTEDLGIAGGCIKYCLGDDCGV